MTPATSSATFGAAYARIYDALYAEKDYGAECDLIESMFRRHGDGRVHRVLDLGCGTGNHALQLAGRGYAVTGVDLSADMLQVAREKTNGTAAFLRGDVRDVDAGGPFDAALLMFAVLGYQRKNADVAATFANVRRHLRPGGVLVFDAWYGPGVLADPPAPRVRDVSRRGERVTRTATASLDVRRHTCAVRYRLSGEDGALLSEETHEVRFFFPMELELFLEHAGFAVERIGAFDDADRAPGAGDWNALVVARAV
jgi:SAM-dependent methyltransferase